MPVISSSGATEYTPLATRAKRAVGLSPTPKDINLPLEGSVVPESKRPLKGVALGRQIRQGLDTVRGLAKRSPSKR